MKNARFKVPNINRDALLAKFLSVPDARLPFRFEFDFERMIFLESAHAEHAHRFKQIDKDQSLPFPFHHEDLPT